MKKLKELNHFSNSELFSALEKVVLKYAKSITYTDRNVEEHDYSALKQHFDDDAIIELTGLIAFQNLSSKFNNALNILPQGFCNISVSQNAKKRCRGSKC